MGWILTVAAVAGIIVIVPAGFACAAVCKAGAFRLD